MIKSEEVKVLPKINIHNAAPKMRLLFLCVLFLIIGFIVGAIYFKSKVVLNTPLSEIRTYGQYKHINPLLECEPGAVSTDHNLNQLRLDIEKYIDSRIKLNKITFASVYYRDLNNGPWFGINPTEKFSPASLIKVPIMITYFRVAEDDPSILEKKILADKDYAYEEVQNILPSNTIIKGNSYTVLELIERMIVSSDNYAYDLLLANIDSELIFKTFEDLGLSIRNDNYSNPTGDIISVKDYASFFRVLFNASYINKEYSEKALEMMTRAEYREGLVAKLPSNVVISHKFGERRYESNRINQLHDCGIIYNGKKPYLLCVMTRGKDISNLSQTIAEISDKIYYKVKDTN